MPRVAVQLTELLADPRWRVRRAAADALARCPARELALRAVLHHVAGPAAGTLVS